MKILNRTLTLTILSLTSAHEAAGISGADALSIGKSLDFCPPSMSGPINEILGVATSAMNAAWSAYFSKHDPLEHLIALSHTIDSGEIIDNNSFKILCGGTLKKLEFEVNVTKVSGLSNLRLDDLTIKESSAGKGESCSDSANSGPFRCVYEGSMDGGVFSSGPLEAVIDLKATLYCSPIFGIDFTKDISPGDTSCNLKKEVSDLEGTYCAGQCSKFPFQPVVSEISIDRLGFDVSSLECSSGVKDFNYLLDLIIEPIKGFISKIVNTKIVEAVNKVAGEIFPLPTQCRSGDVDDGNLSKKNTA